MDPGKMAIASSEIVELSLLADPENAERQKTHQIGEEVRRKLDKSLPKFQIIGNWITNSTHRNVKVEHKQRHRDGEDAVAQGCKSLQTLARDTVVICSQWSSPRFQFNNVRRSDEMMQVPRKLTDSLVKEGPNIFRSIFPAEDEKKKFYLLVVSLIHQKRRVLIR
jgi:hypothetical protein